MKLLLYIIPFVIFMALLVWSKDQFEKTIDAFQHATLQTEQRNSRQ